MRATLEKNPAPSPLLSTLDSRAAGSFHISTYFLSYGDWPLTLFTVPASDKKPKVLWCLLPARPKFVFQRGQMVGYGIFRRPLLTRRVKAGCPFSALRPYGTSTSTQYVLSSGVAGRIAQCSHGFRTSSSSPSSCCHSADQQSGGAQGKDSACTVPPSTTEMSADQAACANLLLIGASTNVCLAVAKGWLGMQGCSVALAADSIHAIVDCAADVIAIWAQRVSSASLQAAPSVSRKERAMWTSCRHRSHYPFGLGRVDNIGALVVAVMLGSAAAALLTTSVEQLGDLVQGPGAAAVASDAGASHHETDHHGHSHEGAERCADDHTAPPTRWQLSDLVHGHSHGPPAITAVDESGREAILWPCVALLLVAMCAKQMLYLRAVSLGTRARSRTLIAYGTHQRADLWCSSLAFVGVVGKWGGVASIDLVAGCILSGWLLRSAWRLAQRAVLDMFDAQHHDQELAWLRREMRLAVSMAAGTSPLSVDADGHHHRPETSSPQMGLVNCFVTRHGPRYVLYGVLVAPPHTSLGQIDALTCSTKAHVNALLMRSKEGAAGKMAANDGCPRHERERGPLPVIDAYFKVLVGEKGGATLPKAIAELTAFHGVGPQTIQVAKSLSEGTSCIDVLVDALPFSSCHGGAPSATATSSQRPPSSCCPLHDGHPAHATQSLRDWLPNGVCRRVPAHTSTPDLSSESECMVDIEEISRVFGAPIRLRRE